MLPWWCYVLALAIIIPLAIYAGRLLFALNHQKKRIHQARQKRCDTICDSIRLIARAVHEKQCEPSEGAIRLVSLLEALPYQPQSSWMSQYPGYYQLYDAVKDLPTHEARKAQTKQQTWQQDKQRYHAESQSAELIEQESLQLSQLNVEVPR